MQRGIGLSILTKQTAIFIFPLLFGYPLLIKKLTIFFKKQAIIPFFLFFGLFIIAIIMTLKFGKANIDQTLFSSDNYTGNVLPRFSIYNLFFYIRPLIKVLSLPIFLLSILSIILMVIKYRNKYTLFFILWIFRF